MGVTGDDSTIYLDSMLSDNPILPKCKHALELCVKVAVKGNVDGALSPSSKAFRGSKAAHGCGFCARQAAASNARRATCEPWL